MVASNTGFRFLVDGVEVYKSWGTQFHITSQAELDAVDAGVGDTIHLGPGTFTASFDHSEPVRIVPENGLSGVVAFQVG